MPDPTTRPTSRARGACPPVGCSNARTAGRAASVPFVAFVLLSGCVDERTLLEPEGPPSTQISDAQGGELAIVHARSAETVASGPAWTIRDEFAAMAERVPGGFGGLFVDGEGAVAMVLRDLGQEASARMALGQEQMIQRRREGSDGDRFTPVQIKVREGAYDYAQLHDWYNELLTALPFPPRMGTISVERNRLFVGVATEAERQSVLALAEQIRLPPSALRVEAVPEPHMTHVQGKHRPVPGGVQGQFKLPGPLPTQTCTIGINVTRLGQTGFLVNSHCTKHAFYVDPSNPTHYWQHRVNEWWEPATKRHIGNEAMDPPVFACQLNANGCRYADVAMGLFNSNPGGSGSVQPDFGRIARPASRNTGELALHATSPRFLITEPSVGWSLGGEVLEKVGRTTGWTGGHVVFEWGPEQEDGGCVDITPAPVDFIMPNPPTLLCQVVVSGPSSLPYAVGGGDSGSPLFRIADGVNVELRGILWGGSGCGFVAPDDLRCDFMLGSNLGGVMLVLDPYNDAPLEYRLPPGNGGGDPGPGDPCEPEGPW